MLITVWFNLWATRLVLHNLGIEDMGVYNVVGSIVGLFSVFSNGLTTTIQRFITFEIGKSKGQQVNAVFCTSLNIIFATSIFIIILLETLGLWFLYTQANIPATSINAAFWVFQLSVLTCIIELISIPYNSLIIAHEKMNAFATISILQVLFNWGSAFVLIYSIQSNRLVLYALLIASANIIIRIIYQAYCRYEFKESKYHFEIRKDLIKEIGKFTGITSSSSILQTITSQGIIIIFNMAFGVGINAVYQIAMQIKNTILSFSLNISRAITPQITKTYANGEMETHKKLVYGGSKIELFMILFIIMPFIFRADYIMHLWLGNVPPYATSFTICMLLLSLTYAGFEPIRSSVMATNKIFRFMIYPEVFYLIATLIGACLVIIIYKNPNAMIATFVGLEIMTCFIRTLIARKETFISLTELLQKVVVPSGIIMCISTIICYILSLITAANIWGLITMFAIHTIAISAAIYLLGCNKSEKIVILQICSKIFTK